MLESGVFQALSALQPGLWICYRSRARKVPQSLWPRPFRPRQGSAMLLNPLAPVIDHQSMLNRIFWFTTASALAAVWLIRLNIPTIDQALAEIDLRVAVGDGKLLPVPGGFLLPALAVGMLTRVYRMHSRISDWLGIRECFDIDVIISELAARSDIDMTAIPRDELVAHRHRIMRRAFYPFVSGAQPQIDTQLIQQALDSWSWLWIGIEATSVFVVASLGLVAGGVYAVGLRTLVATLVVAAIGLPAIHRQCRRYAVAQVRAIVADAARAAEVGRAMSELSDDRRAARRAA